MRGKKAKLLRRAARYHTEGQRATWLMWWAGPQRRLPRDENGVPCLNAEGFTNGVQMREDKTFWNPRREVRQHDSTTRCLYQSLKRTFSSKVVRAAIQKAFAR